MSLTYWNDSLAAEREGGGLVYCLLSQTAQECVAAWPVEDQTDYDRETHLHDE